MDKLIKLKEISNKNKEKRMEPIIKKRGNLEKYWETSKSCDWSDPRFNKELNGDQSNNKMMERLNCELDFRVNKKKKKTSNIIKPYDDSDDNDDSDSDF